MKRKGLVYIICLLMLTACNQNDSFYMESTAADGLAIGSPIFVGALQIGKIEDMVVSNDHKVIFKAGVKQGLKISKNSKFKNVVNDERNERVVEIALGNGYEILGRDDTVGITKNFHEIVDSLVETVRSTLFETINKKVNEKREEK